MIGLEEIRGSVARGYCTKENENKVLDTDLCEAISAEVKKLVDMEFRIDAERLIVQLAGCLTAAEGVGMDNTAPLGSYGWSPAYQATLDLRRKYDELMRRNYAVVERNQEEYKEGNCQLCGEPMPGGEKMFKFHGYSCDCPKKE